MCTVSCRVRKVNRHRRAAEGTNCGWNLEHNERVNPITYLWWIVSATHSFPFKNSECHHHVFNIVKQLSSIDPHPSITTTMNNIPSRPLFRSVSVLTYPCASYLYRLLAASKSSVPFCIFHSNKYTLDDTSSLSVCARPITKSINLP